MLMVLFVDGEIVVEMSVEVKLVLFVIDGEMVVEMSVEETLVLMFIDGEVVVGITVVAKIKFTGNVQEKEYLIYFNVVLLFSLLNFVILHSRVLFRKE